MKSKQQGRVGWVALGLIVGLVAAWGGFGLVGAATSAPSAITTCTKASNGKSKIIAGDDVSSAKCTKKGKGFVKSWTDAAELRYHNLARGTQQCGIGPTNDFSHMDLSGLFMSGCYDRGNFTGSDFTGSDLRRGFFQDATLTNAILTNTDLTLADFFGATTAGANTAGASWNQTACPDGTQSNTNGTVPQTCVGHGF